MCNVSDILWVQYVVHVMLFNRLYFIIIIIIIIIIQSFSL